MARYVRRDGLLLRVGSKEWRWWLAHRLLLEGKVQKTTHRERFLVASFANTLVGITEDPRGSNSGQKVKQIQSATGAYNAPWCVSTVQYIWKHTIGTTWAMDTAGAYELEAYARAHNGVTPKPWVGASVVYHLGDGHAGTIVRVNRNGTFYAVEGNYGDAVARVYRDPHTVPCTCMLRPELR